MITTINAETSYLRDFVAEILENWIYKADHGIDTIHMLPINSQQC